MNKKLLFIAGAFAILCFAALAFSNSFIAEKIDDAVSDYIREIENDSNLEIGYDDLTYNLITSTITLQDPRTSLKSGQSTSKLGWMICEN
jgi:hypothetical protein